MASISMKRICRRKSGRDREAISFTKGCYLGQETVARIDALGHVNQRLVGVRFFGSDVPSGGMELTREGRSGRVRDVGRVLAEVECATRPGHGSA